VIVASHRKLKAGHRDCGLTDANRVKHGLQPFAVVRKATFQEWKQQATMEGVERDTDENSHKRLGIVAYYEISTD